MERAFLLTGIDRVGGGRIVRSRAVLVIGRRRLPIPDGGEDVAAGTVELGDYVYLASGGWERVSVRQGASIGGVNAVSFNGYPWVGIGERIFRKRQQPGQISAESAAGTQR